MTIKSIVIEWRNPRTKDEADCWGETFVYNEVATVYINLQKNKKSREAIDTFFHEMTHVFVGFHRLKPKMGDKKEEYLATKVGNIVADLLS